MQDGRDRRHTVDESGNTWLTDASGKIVTDGSGNRVPGPAKPLGPPPSHPSQGYSFYDESRGHCGLCGRLTCNGRCFK